MNGRRVMVPALGGTFQDDGSHLAGNGMVLVLVSRRGMLDSPEGAWRKVSPLGIEERFAGKRSWGLERGWRALSFTVG